MIDVSLIRIGCISAYTFPLSDYCVYFLILCFLFQGIYDYIS
jgi:hypothetical protein